MRYYNLKSESRSQERQSISVSPLNPAILRTSQSQAPSAKAIAMPAPPTEIRIKRKATDDPVELLHVQNEYNGLRQIKQYVFKRQRTSTAPSVNILNPLNLNPLRAQQPPVSSPSNPPVTAASQPAEAPVTYIQGLKQTSGSLRGAVLNANVKTSTNQSSRYGINKQPSITSKTELRRFHLSRSPIPTPAGLPSGYLRGAKGPPAVFIERRRTPELQNKVSNTSLARGIDTSSQTASTSHRKNGDDESQWPSADDQSRPPAPLRNVKMPSGRVVPWDTDSATLAAQMQAYTMQEIGHNLAKSSTPETLVTSTPVIRARQVSSFKPKAPALRYHERDLEKARAANATKGSNQDEVMADAADQDGDDSDYIMETYIRMPAEMFEYEEQKSVGLLVLDSQPDIDEFYNDDSDSDSEIYDEEEDENAENHPSTDYPEDEVESDDEYGCNPYGRYRNQNASENEEYDEDDITYSDDDAKPQWARRPWMVNNPYRRNEEHEADDD